MTTKQWFLDLLSQYEKDPDFIFEDKLFQVSEDEAIRIREYGDKAAYFENKHGNFIRALNNDEFREYKDTTRKIINNLFIDK